jgi:two-component system OmpR family response regulator
LTLSPRVLGYEVCLVDSVPGAQSSDLDQFDVILFRAASTDVFGLRSLSQLRSRPYYPPVIAVSKCADRADVPTFLECGCDCVLSEVQDVLQLKAWIESLVRRRDMYRRAQEQADAVIRVGDLEIDVLARMVRTKAKSSELTEREMRLLLELARKPGIVCRRAELLEKVWGTASESLTGTLNTHINRLRLKIEDDFKTPQRLIGVYGVGYRLAVVVGAAEETPAGTGARAAEPDTLGPTDETIGPFALTRDRPPAER